MWPSTGQFRYHTNMQQIQHTELLFRPQKIHQCVFNFIEKYIWAVLFQNSQIKSQLMLQTSIDFVIMGICQSRFFFGLRKQTIIINFHPSGFPLVCHMSAYGKALRLDYKNTLFCLCESAAYMYIYSPSILFSYRSKV